MNPPRTIPSDIALARNWASPAVNQRQSQQPRRKLRWAGGAARVAMAPPTPRNTPQNPFRMLTFSGGATPRSMRYQQRMAVPTMHAARIARVRPESVDQKRKLVPPGAVMGEHS